MKKVHVEHIETRDSANDFAKLLSENKTYFLNGAWGTGKTEFIKQVEDIIRRKTGIKFVYLELWEIKDERTVTNIAFTEFYKYRAFFLKLFVILCVVVSLLMTDFINLGFESILHNDQLQWVIKLGGVTALTVAVWQFFKIKSDEVFNRYFRRKWLIWERKKIKNKVLVIDDFDRISEDKQQEAYKLFNILKGKLPIVFLGDFTKISTNGDKYLQKIIDRYIELPYSLHPNNIWNSYFYKIEKMLGFEAVNDLINLFVYEERNLREQVHFNDYVNLEFFEREKMGHVQVNQQLLIIYLYLFHKEYYKKLLTGWLPEYKNKESKSNKNFFQNHSVRKVFENDFERIIFEILDENEEYPKSYKKNKQGYFLFENISNLAIKEALSILNDDTKLKKNIISHGSRDDDFYSFVVAKYREWWPYARDDQVRKKLFKEETPVNDEIKRIERLTFQLIKGNEMSDLTKWLVSEIVNRELSILGFDNDTKEANYKNDFFNENYLDGFDLSQKIHFYVVHHILQHNQILELFKEKISETITDEEMYGHQKKKPYILSMMVLNEKSHWVNFENWDEGLKDKIAKLKDEDFITFWELYRIIKLEYNSTHNADKLSRINKIVLQTSQFDVNSSKNVEKHYNQDMINFIASRLEKISEKRKIPLSYTNGRSERTKL